MFVKKRKKKREKTKSPLKFAFIEYDFFSSNLDIFHVLPKKRFGRLNMILNTKKITKQQLIFLLVTRDV